MLEMSILAAATIIFPARKMCCDTEFDCHDSDVCLTKCLDNSVIYYTILLCTHYKLHYHILNQCKCKSAPCLQHNN